MFDPQHFVG